MIARHSVRWLLSASLVSSAFAAPTTVDPPAAPKQHAKWMLDSFIVLAQEQPRRLLHIAEQLFADDRVRVSTMEPSRAFEWQHRLAVVSALSQIFESGSPTERALGKDAVKVRMRARSVLRTALRQDPSLLVRDGAVESIRRILRMRKNEASYWGGDLESAFLDPKNGVEGEGLFIRTTILTAMREGSLKPSRKLRHAAEADANGEVRALLKNWDTSAYDEL